MDVQRNVKELYKLSEEEKKNFLKKEAEILSNAEKFDLYEDYIAMQKKPFMDLMNYLNNYINELKARGKISDYVEFRARIKAPSNAIENDSKKALDDCFGMELICATEEEIHCLIDELYKLMDVTDKVKHHNKPNGYKAEHFYSSLKKEVLSSLYPNMTEQEKEGLNFPLVEFQLKTIAVDIQANSGSAGHAKYKKADPFEVQNMYDRGDLIVGRNLPRMWCSVNGKMELLSDMQTARKIYPFLDISHTKEQNQI